MQFALVCVSVSVWVLYFYVFHKFVMIFMLFIYKILIVYCFDFNFCYFAFLHLRVCVFPFFFFWFLPFLCAFVGNHLLIKQDPGVLHNRPRWDVQQHQAFRLLKVRRATIVWPRTQLKSWTGVWINWKPFKHIAVSPTWHR